MTVTPADDIEARVVRPVIPPHGLHCVRLRQAGGRPMLVFYRRRWEAHLLRWVFRRQVAR